MELNANNTRDVIIYSAIELFADNGYTETTMKSIANAANIKPASIYNHFESKKQILECIFDIYSNVAKEKIPYLTEEYIKENDAKAVLKELFFKFEGNESMIYRQILKIFLQEQYRIEEARYFMKTLYIESTQSYIQYVLDKMVEFKKIAPVDTALFAEILHAINVKATVVAGHYINAPKDSKNDRWEEALSLVIDFIVNAKEDHE